MLNFTRLSQPIIKSADQLRKGDVIQTLSATYAFDKFPRGARSWHGKSMENGKSYRIRIMRLFDAKFNVIGTYTFEASPRTMLKPMANDITDLRVGDLFVIKHGRGENAELFRYIRSTDKKVIAVNPVTNKTFNIDKSFAFTKIANLPY